MQQAADEFRAAGKRIGVVPTMGYLHEGHLSLIRIAREHADVVITTIFVNPTQFAPHEDFAKYPRDLQRDTRLAETAGTDILFVPDTREMYPEGYLTYVEVEKITQVLEGKSRPTHFRGVATVVAKLFNITKPHIAVFGQKDAQQVAVIKRLVRDMNFDVEIIVGSIVREPDGLALSSRNVYLSAEERSDATVLAQSLSCAAELVRGGEKDCSVLRNEMRNLISSKHSTRIDYISIVEAESLEELERLRSGDIILISLAVFVGDTRLIDNSLVTVP